jgi:hypothetical protein
MRARPEWGFPGARRFPSRIDPTDHLSTRQHARLVDEWVTGIGLRSEDYGTHSLRRTKAALIYKQTGNLRAVQILLGHTKIESTVRYLGVDIEDALALAEATEVGRTAGARLTRAPATSAIGGKRTLEQLEELSDPVRLAESVRNWQPDHRAATFVNNFDPFVGRSSTLHGFVGGELRGNSRRFRFRCKPIWQFSAD